MVVEILYGKMPRNMLYQISAEKNWLRNALNSSLMYSARMRQEYNAKKLLGWSRKCFHSFHRLVWSFFCLKTNAKPAHYSQEALVNAKGGYLCARFKYYRAHNKVDENEPNMETRTDIESASNAIQHLTINDNNPTNDSNNDLIQMNNVRVLRSFLVNDVNMEFFKQQLLETLQYRTRLIQNENIDFRVEFPYFFTNCELVHL